MLAEAERELVDLNRATLEIADMRVVVDGKAHGSTANGKRRRVISLDPLTVFYLRLHLAMLGDEWETLRGRLPRFRVAHLPPDGRPVHSATVTDRLNELVDRAGVKRIRLHDMQHAYSTTALGAGIDPKAVADRVGHANRMHTLAIYTHRSTGKDRYAAETPSRNSARGWVDVRKTQQCLHRHHAG